MRPWPSAGLIRAFESKGYELPNDSAVTSIGSYEDQQAPIHIAAEAAAAELPESSDAVAVLTSQLITPFSGFNHRSIRCRAPSSPPADNRSFRYPWITCCSSARQPEERPRSRLSRDQAIRRMIDHCAIQRARNIATSTHLREEHIEPICRLGRVRRHLISCSPQYLRRHRRRHGRRRQYRLLRSSGQLVLPPRFLLDKTCIKTGVPNSPWLALPVFSAMNPRRRARTARRRHSG